MKILLIMLKQYATDALKTDLERAIQKIAEATDDLIGNVTADRITSLENFTTE